VAIAKTFRLAPRQRPFKRIAEFVTTLESADWVSAAG
jgi:hypothetical protein